MTALNICMLITASINLGVGCFVFLKNMRSSLNQSFLLFCIGSSLWTISYVFLSYTHLLVFDRLILLGSLVSTAGIFLFSKYFPTAPQHLITKRDGFLLIPLLLCSFLLFDNLIIERVQVINTIPVPHNGPLFGFFATVLLCYFGASIYYLVRNYKHSNPIEQNRALIFTFSLATFVLVSVLFDLLLPLLGYLTLNFVGPLFLSLFVGACAYTLLTKKLLDITLILQKTFIYTTLLVVVTLLYYLLITAIQTYLLGAEEISFATNLLTVAIVAMSVPFIDTQLRRVSDTWLGGMRYHYSGVLLEIVKEISTTDTLESTIEGVTQKISTVMKAQDTCITIAPYNSCLCTPDPVFVSRDTHLFIPITFQNQYIATLSVKNKKSGEPFTKQDTDFLQTVSVYLSAHLKTQRVLQETRHHSHLLKEEMRESEDVTLQLKETQSKMIVDIAHNLQTPLTILKGEIHSLQQAHQRFTRRDLEKLDVTVDRFSQFVTRLLQAGDTTQHTLHMHVFNLSELIREVCEYTTTVAESRNAVFSYHIGEDILMHGDPTRIRDVVVNLLGNAMKYKKNHGTHTIHLSLSAGERTTLTVTDTGVGIEAEHLPYIFKPWYQADTQQRGSGLGLSIVQQTVHQHRGTVEVSSTYGSGTTFTLTFPLQKTVD